MMAALYPSKKALREAIGKPFRYRETSYFGTEYATGKMLTVVGPSEHSRKWYANVWLHPDGTIAKVK